MKKIGIVGMGKMGSAIYSNLDKDKEFEIYRLNKHSDLKQLLDTEIVVIAIKPQVFNSLAKDLKKYLSNQYIISIMAGLTTRQISNALNTKKIIRTMPSISLRYGNSITAVYPKLIDGDIFRILSNWGELLYLTDEEQFHSFTALSSSSPAYFLRLAQEIESIALKNGYDNSIAQKLSINSLYSASSLLKKNNGDITNSINEIKSKKGVTEQALFILDNGLEIVQKAVNSAINRSKEISDGLK